MKAALAMALVCLAVAGSGCDAVFGNLTIPYARHTDFTAVSQDSGADATGGVHTVVCCPTYFDYKVTCLRVEGNRATIGTDTPNPYTQAGQFWYVEDNPGEGNDRITEGQADSPPTTCPAPPTTFPDDSVVPGDVHVVNDYHSG